LSLKQYTPGEDFEVIVVDNGSSDETHTHCPIVGQNLFGQQFRYIRLEKNINFGPACNLGAKKSQGHFLFFLNNDTLVTENWLPPLLNAFDEDKNLGAVGPLLLYPDNTVQHFGVCISPLELVSHLYEYFPQTHPVLQKKRKVQVITGAAFLISKSLFFQCDGFYEAYKNGYEDIDLCVQIHRAGKALLVLPETIIYHYTSQSSGRFDYEKENSSILNKRCRDRLVPDLHKFYVEDGYNFQLTFFLNILPELSQEQLDNLYYDKPDKFDYDWYMQKLSMEPFWLQGYNDLWQYWIQEKNWPRVLELMNRLVYIFPMEIVLPKLEYLSKKIHNDLLNQKIHQIRDFLIQRKALIQERIQNGYLQDLAAKDEILRPVILKWQLKYGLK
jgi:glycosyltransferase involved in cell wall biosynthesis